MNAVACLRSLPTITSRKIYTLFTFYYSFVHPRRKFCSRSREKKSFAFCLLNILVVVLGWREVEIGEPRIKNHKQIPTTAMKLNLNRPGPSYYTVILIYSRRRARVRGESQEWQPFSRLLHNLFVSENRVYEAEGRVDWISQRLVPGRFCREEDISIPPPRSTRGRWLKYFIYRSSQRQIMTEISFVNELTGTSRHLQEF
jgi:hypothetical protein